VATLKPPEKWDLDAHKGDMGLLIDATGNEVKHPLRCVLATGVCEVVDPATGRYELKRFPAPLRFFRQKD